MRKLLYLSVAAFAALLISCEEQPALREAPVMAPVDADALVAQHPEYLDGTDMLCPTGPVQLTPAPKGYKAFYLSHYGRHGARYAWQSDMYSRLHKVFGAAKEEDNLTELGVSYRERFESLYPEVQYRTGDLSRKGWQQQQELAQRMYHNFPELFGDDAYVMARTSTSTRCVMTMSAFCLGLKGMNPKLDIFENFGRYFLPAILPLDGSNPFREEHYLITEEPFEETYEQYVARNIDSKTILTRLFKDPDKAVEPAKQWDFVSYLYFFAAGMKSLDTDLEFYDIFTPEERVALWKADNFQFYWYAWPTRYGYMPIVKDIIAMADERIASGKKGADLRFGHDYTILPLMMILDLDGMGKEVTDPDDISSWCRTSQVPMGANVHFVFYKNNAGNVLFKVLHNGKEATLPIDTENWPYYSWDAFKAQYTD
jgi:hypothetical protein